MTVEEVTQLALYAGEFLIFLNKDKNLETTLAVVDERSELVCKTIRQNKGNYFWIRPEDQDLRFSIIEHMIEYYITYKEEIESNAEFSTVLSKPIHNPSKVKNLLVENSKTTKDLTYCYENLSDDDVAKLLVNDGDYLIRQVPTEDGNAFQVCVFWDKVVKMAMTISDVPEELLLLPRASEFEPTEGVLELDHLLKSLTVGNCVVDGVQFKRAVCDHEKEESVRPRQTIMNITRMLGFTEAFTGNIPLTFPNRLFNLLKYRAPRPLHLLPYYHGVTSEAIANSRLCCPGDFLVYVNASTEKLCIASYEQIKAFQVWWHTNIWCSVETGYFWIRPEDENLKLTCVELLIAYYQERQIPLQDLSIKEQLKDQQSRALFCITTPIVSPEYMKNINVEYTDCVEELSYHFGNISDDEVEKLLQRNGDYLLRNNEFGQPFLSIRWGDKIVDHQIPYSAEIGRTILPRDSEAGPIESIFSIDQYVKALVRCQYSIDGAVPRNAIQEGEKSLTKKRRGKKLA
ncbi:hypothetical protein D918_06739 [Trichuris suis]|nr:hypothetical protein D918_06739 [Trichuris suis]